MILGGGPGRDLRPLTDRRAEPAMPFAGLFRLIDFPISNCINSGALPRGGGPRLAVGLVAVVVVVVASAERAAAVTSG
jgi:hypothetical protein